MASNDKLIDNAVTILTGNFHREDSIDKLMYYLDGFSPFDSMDDDEIEPVAMAAQGRLPPRPGAKSAKAGGRGPAPGHHPARQAPPARRVDPNLTPSAPFRFVTLPDQVVMPPEPVRLDTPLEDGFCAQITVEWAAETPLLIGETNAAGIVEPLRLGTDGGYVIPGASLRGMIRAAVEIVAHGRLGAANLHHRYGLRDFEHPAYSQRSPVSRVEEVKAGWLHWHRLEDGSQEWRITPCDWAHVAIDDLLTSKLRRWPTTDRSQWIGKDLLSKYADAGMKQGSLVDFDTTYGFSRAAEVNGRRMVRPGGPERAALVFANKLPGKDGKKKYEYVFFAPTGTPTALKPDIVAMFERLYSKPSKNRPEPDGSWKILRPVLEKGRRLPVFMVGDLETQDAGFFFGLTRLFKVPHERSVGDVLFGSQPAHRPGIQRDADGTMAGYQPDFVENLFGYVVERDDVGLAGGDRVSPDAVARKGRVAFSFAQLAPKQTVECSSPLETVMMAPRASFAPYYLRSSAEKDYSADTMPKLAGRKRYLPRRQPGEMAKARSEIADMGHRQLRLIEEASRGQPVSDEVKSRLRFLMPKNAPELRFRSIIRLHNVTAAELGAVLFALTHGGDVTKPYRHMIGRARPFGAGQLRVASARLAVEANDGSSDLIKSPNADEWADATGMKGFCPPDKENKETDKNASHRPFLDEFMSFMRKQPGLAAFPDVVAIREFLGAADPDLTARSAGRLDYSPLKDFNDLRKAVKPLKPSQDGRPASPPHLFPQDKDGRLLPAPSKAAR